MADEHSGLRYMTRFQCLGSACEDPCCHHWQIAVDEPHFRAIADALGDSPDGQRELARAIRKLPVVDQTPARVGDMALGDDHFCVMLDEDKLCSLHRRFGDDVLSDTCASYPRAVGRLGERLEMSGVTSCPEVVRLMLADDAVDVVPFDPARFARRNFIHELDGADAARFVDVRALLGDVLCRREPLALRHMLLATFAERVAIRGADELDATCAQFRDLRVLAELAKALAAASVDETFALAVVLAVIDAEDWSAEARFDALVQRITARYAPARKKGAFDARQAAKLFARRRDALPSHLVARLEHQLERYARSNIYQEWYTACPTLLDFVTLHLVQVAVIRFLVISHPATSTACREPPAHALRHLDAVFVECVSAFSRAAHHSSGLGARIMRKLSDGGLQTAAHLFSLARL